MFQRNSQRENRCAQPTADKKADRSVQSPPASRAPTSNVSEVEPEALRIETVDHVAHRLVFAFELLG
jgi:hypothetical protein